MLLALNIYLGTDSEFGDSVLLLVILRSIASDKVSVVVNLDL